MDASLAAVLGGLGGVAVTAVAFAATRWSDARRRCIPDPATPQVSHDVSAVLSVLGSSAVVLGPHDQVLQASTPARTFGLVTSERLENDELLELVRQVRRDGQVRTTEMELRRRRFGPAYVVEARVAPLGSDQVLLLVEDRTRARQIEQVRRDFVANVSHELKTPIGALTVLSDAVEDSPDDPEAVQRFAGRMRVEAGRLGRLVNEIIELSRLQGADPLIDLQPVTLRDVTEPALDRCRVDAVERTIELVNAVPADLVVSGVRSQLTMAIGNLIENAVNYSPDETRVVVSGERRGGLVELRVTDQGCGISPDDAERVFERFYRVDPARSRATGGTGLGLSIVKHVMNGHGGEVAVWSALGQGSTFTLRFPAPAAENASPADAAPTTRGARALPPSRSSQSDGPESVADRNRNGTDAAVREVVG